MRENSHTEKYFQHARWLVESGYPTPTQNIEELAHIIKEGEDKMIEYGKKDEMKPTNNYIPKIEESDKTEQIQQDPSKKLWKTNDDLKTEPLLYHPRPCPHCGKDTNVRVVNLQENK